MRQSIPEKTNWSAWIVWAVNVCSLKLICPRWFPEKVKYSQKTETFKQNAYINIVMFM